MARVNIEEKWWTDPRRKMLARLVGNEYLADGIMVSVWRLAQTYRGRGNGLIPHHVWNAVEANSSIVEANLAKIEADGVYVYGSHDHLDWVVEKRQQAIEAGKKGGRKSGQRPRDERGRFLPSQATTKHNPSDTPSDWKNDGEKREKKSVESHHDALDKSLLGQATTKRLPSDTPSEIQADPSESKPSVSDSDNIYVCITHSGNHVGSQREKSEIKNHAVGIFERRFTVKPEDLDAIEDYVNQAFLGHVPPRIANRIPDLAAAFGTADNFATHLTEILADPRASPDAPKFRSFIEGCLLRQIEVLK